MTDKELILLGLLPRWMLPNSVGFKFLAHLNNGAIIIDEVFTDENGLHTCKTFKDMKGWQSI